MIWWGCRHPGRGLLHDYEPSCGPSFEALLTTHPHHPPPAAQIMEAQDFLIYSWLSAPCSCSPCWATNSEFEHFISNDIWGRQQVFVTSSWMTRPRHSSQPGLRPRVEQSAFWHRVKSINLCFGKHPTFENNESSIKLVFGCWKCWCAEYHWKALQCNVLFFCVDRNRVVRLRKCAARHRLIRMNGPGHRSWAAMERRWCKLSALYDQGLWSCVLCRNIGPVHLRVDKHGHLASRDNK